MQLGPLLIAKGIIDPLIVTGCAIENAAAIAGMILTTEALITDLPGSNGSEAGYGEGVDYQCADPGSISLTARTGKL